MVAETYSDKEVAVGTCLAIGTLFFIILILIVLSPLGMCFKYLCPSMRLKVVGCNPLSDDQRSDGGSDIFNWNSSWKKQKKQVYLEKCEIELLQQILKDKFYDKSFGKDELESLCRSNADAQQIWKKYEQIGLSLRQFYTRVYKIHGRRIQKEKEKINNEMPMRFWPVNN